MVNQYVDGRIIDPAHKQDHMVSRNAKKNCLTIDGPQLPHLPSITWHSQIKF